MNLLCLLVLLAACKPVLSTWDTCGGTCGLWPMAASYSPITYDYDPMASEYGTLSIVGGTGVQPGAWPGIVSIQYPRKPGMGHICGGSLISTQWVLTAAHCFIDTRKWELSLSKWRVVIGATRLTQLGPEVQLCQIKQLQVHEHYNPVRKPSDVLQEAKVHLIDVQLYNSSWWYVGAIHTHNLCAGYPQSGIDTCQGDSGGPLVCKDNHAAYFWLVGLFSWGKGCAIADQLGVYTSTQHFYDWIHIQIDLQPDRRTWSHFMTVSTPSQKQMPVLTPSGWFSSCRFSLQQLVEIFTWLQEFLQALRRKLAREAE